MDVPFNTFALFESVNKAAFAGTHWIGMYSG
jgi:hypothetical protein